MPHPFMMVNAPAWTLILGYLKDGIAFVVSHDNILSESGLQDVIKQYVEAIARV